MKLGAFFVEILPLLAFFVGYQYFGLIAAAFLSVGIGGLLLGLAWLLCGGGGGWAGSGRSSPSFLLHFLTKWMARKVT